MTFLAGPGTGLGRDYTVFATVDGPRPVRARSVATRSASASRPRPPRRQLRQPGAATHEARHPSQVPPGARSSAARATRRSRSARRSPSCASTSAPTATRSSRASRRSSTPRARSSASRSASSARRDSDRAGAAAADRPAPGVALRDSTPMARVRLRRSGLLEGVLMRGRDAIGVAVRGPDGRSSPRQEPLNSILHRNRFARAPFFRGLVVLYETLVIGTRWLMRSGSIAAAGEGVAMGGRRARADAAVHGRPGRRPVRAAAAVPRPGRATPTLAIGGRLRRSSQHLVEGLIRVAHLRGLPAARQPLQRDPARLPVPRRRAHDDPRARARGPARRSSTCAGTRRRTRAAAPSSWSSSSSSASCCSACWPGRAAGSPSSAASCSSRSSRRSPTRSCAGAPSAASSWWSAGCSCPASGCRPSRPSSPTTR